MAQFPCLPLWTDAWIADTAHLTRCERGTYHDLLVLMWRTPGCQVPNDNEWLAKHLRMTLAEVVAELRPLITEFCQTDGNWIFQKRLRLEFVHRFEFGKLQKERVKKRWRAHRSKKLGESVSDKPLNNNTSDDFPGNAGPVLPPSPSPSTHTATVFPTAATTVDNSEPVAKKQQLDPARSFASAPCEGALAREPDNPPAEPKRSADKDPMRKTMAEINYEAFGIGTGRRKRTY